VFSLCSRITTPFDSSMIIFNIYCPAGPLFTYNTLIQPLFSPSIHNLHHTHIFAEENSFQKPHFTTFYYFITVLLKYLISLVLLSFDGGKHSLIGDPHWALTLERDCYWCPAIVRRGCGQGTWLPDLNGYRTWPSARWLYTLWDARNYHGQRVEIHCNSRLWISLFFFVLIFLGP